MTELCIKVCAAHCLRRVIIMITSPTMIAPSQNTRRCFQVVKERKRDGCSKIKIPSLCISGDYQGKIDLPRNLTARIGNNKTEIMPALTSMAPLSDGINPEDTPISLMITIRGRPVAE